MGTRLAWWVLRANLFLDLGQKCPGGTLNRCFWGVQQGFVARDWGEAQVCDPWVL